MKITGPTNKLAGRTVYVAGHTGLVGSAVMRALAAIPGVTTITRTHQQLDLTRQAAVETFFAKNRPDAVVLCAAKVGGIVANDTYPAAFIQENLSIQSNVLTSAHEHGVKDVIFLGSSCIYPRDCPQPIREDALLTGPLESTNRPYAIAKIAGIEQCWSLNRQFGTRFLALMPTNLFGPADNYDLETAHVLPALIHRFVLATDANLPSVTLWGNGEPRREFLHSDDLARAVLHALSDPGRILSTLPATEPPLINVGFGADISIRELAAMIATEAGFTGAIQWDSSRPNGTPSKLLDSQRIRALGWKPDIPLRAGVRAAIAEFKALSL